MVKRIAPIRVIVILLLVAGGVWGQTASSSVDLLAEGDSNRVEVQSPEKGTSSSFPDAPSATLPTPTARFQAFVVGANSSFTRTMVGINPVLIRQPASGRVIPSPPPTFGTSYRRASVGNGTNTFFGRYLYPSSLKPKLRYNPSTSTSFLRRVSYAASRIFITRDESGKGRLNSSYFLGALTSVAIHTAYRPYWTRSASASFVNLGSTIGGDAGINFFHEFAPGIRQMIKGRPTKIGMGSESANTSRLKPREVISAAR
jgi:hypothetical protein